MKSILTSLLLLTATALSAAEDDVPFNGLVVDLTGKPLKNVKIWVKEPHRYAKSNKQGQFGLTNVAPTDTLHIKFKGEHYDIPVDGRKSMRIRLADQWNAEQDDELVELGYGYVKKRESTSPTNGISGEELVRTGETFLLQALRGKVPGMKVSSNGMNDGGIAQIRGVGSINQSTEPLYIVDGVRVSSLDYLNVHDVDHVQILKDGSMYGSSGANGVILVTTKHGSK